MTICSALWDIGLTAVGVIIGYFVAVRYDRNKTREEFLQSHRLSMNALVSSLKTSSKHINQMFTIEMKNGLYPSYPLDTTALSLIIFGASPYLPENTDWPERFNRLRFEMDHINRRLLMDYVAHRPINATEIQTAYALYNTNGQTSSSIPSQPWSGIVTLLLACKSAIDAQIQELEKFGYKGDSY